MIVVVLLASLCGFVVEASRPGCNVALGMEDERIYDWQLRSYSHDRGYYPSDGRLNGRSAWCSDSETAWKEYFQIRLDKVRHISGIGTQGYKSTLFGSYWVKSYAIEYSYNGYEWYWYKDNTASATPIKEFYANTDANTEKRIQFRDTFVTKYLRIYPIKFEDDMCLRVELYGCTNDKDCSTVLTRSSGLLSSPNYPFSYPLGMDCTWIINLSDKSKRIAVFFKYFDVNYGTSHGCHGDFVEAINGHRDVSPSLGRFCNGTDTPVIESTASVMRLHFHSTSDSKARKGFQIAYYSYTKGVDNVFRAAACTGSSLSLDCSSKSIKILHAFYGALPFSTRCGSHGNESSCLASGMQQTVTTLCEHYKVCQVDISGPQFSLSCGAGLVPHVDVYYRCTGTVIKTLPPTTTTTTTTIAPLPPSTTTPPSTTNTATSQIPDSTASPVTSSPLTEPSTSSSHMTGGSSTSTPTVSATRGEAGDKFARAGEDNPGMLAGIVVAAIFVVIVVVVVLVCFLYRRRRKQKDKPMPGVTYIAPQNAEDTEPPFCRRGRGSSRTNPYETVNVLYISADDARYKDEEMEHIYDCPELQEPLPKMTDNPLYHGTFDLDGYEPACYESIDCQNKSASKPPPSLDPAIYDSPLPVIQPKSGTSKSISNPNYDKTIEIRDK